MGIHLLIFIVLVTFPSTGTRIQYEWSGDSNSDILFPKSISILDDLNKSLDSSTLKNQIQFMQKPDGENIKLYRSYLAVESIGSATLPFGSQFVTTLIIVVHNCKVVDIDFISLDKENAELVTIEFQKIEFLSFENGTNSPPTERFGWDFVNQQEFGENSNIGNFSVHDPLIRWIVMRICQ